MNKSVQCNRKLMKAEVLNVSMRNNICLKNKRLHCFNTILNRENELCTYQLILLGSCRDGFIAYFSKNCLSSLLVEILKWRGKRREWCALTISCIVALYGKQEKGEGDR